MIGVVVVTHSQLGHSLIETAEFILGTKPENVEPVSINVKKDVDELRIKIADAIKKVDSGLGVFILTDMFGGTPSNLSYSFLEDGKIEVISGVNLPILIRAISMQGNTDLSKAANSLVSSGKRSISLASGILKGSKPDE